MRVHGLIRQLRTHIDFRVHADRGAVDNDVIFFYHLRCNLIILYRPRTLEAADEHRLQSQRPQTIVDGLRSATSAQYERFLMVPVQERFYTLGEADDITVVSAQDNILALMRHTYNIDSSDGIASGLI